MQTLVILARLLSGLALGVAFGYSVRRVTQSGRQPWQAAILQVVLLILTLSSAAIATWILPAREVYLFLTQRVYALGTYCLGFVAGLVMHKHYPISKKPEIILLLDIFVLSTLWCLFVALVVSKVSTRPSQLESCSYISRKVSIYDLPIHTWGGLAVSAGAFGLATAIAQNFGLTGRWRTNLLPLSSACALVFIDLQQWIEVMHRGFVYMDMAEAFVEGLAPFLVCLLVFPLSLALGIAGFLVAYKKADYHATIASLAQLAFLGLRLVCEFLPD
ncbi:MAG: hypothetical protein JW918_03700 [Anaerolineae bacterium]|nr:hypothetical protein [Anaerolineae bacterium]